MIEVLFQSIVCGLITYAVYSDFPKSCLVFIIIFNILFALEKINDSIKDEKERHIQNKNS